MLCTLTSVVFVQVPTQELDSERTLEASDQPRGMTLPGSSDTGVEMM